MSQTQVLNFDKKFDSLQAVRGHRMLPFWPSDLSAQATGCCIEQPVYMGMRYYIRSLIPIPHSTATRKCTQDNTTVVT